jgi:hypothetical protein
MVDFDHLSTGPLNGDSGGTYWGMSQWSVYDPSAAPLSRMTGNAMSFSGYGTTSATLSFDTPGELSRFDVVNSSMSPTSVSVSCTNGPTYSQQIPGDSRQTLIPNFNGACVGRETTITAQNGWQTMFDNLVVFHPAPTPTPTLTPYPTWTPTATPTITPTATSTSTPTATPTPVTYTLNFESSPAGPLNGGRYDVDWGTNQWAVYAANDPQPSFVQGNAVSFANSGIASATAKFARQTRLLHVDAENGGTALTQVTLSCVGSQGGSNPDIRVDVEPQSRQTLSPTWTGTCSAVTISALNGWATWFDNLTYSQFLSS